jgi:hypothetical protein
MNDRPSRPPRIDIGREHHGKTFTELKVPAGSTPVVYLERDGHLQRLGPPAAPQAPRRA